LKPKILTGKQLGAEISTTFNTRGWGTKFTDLKVSRKCCIVLLLNILSRKLELWELKREGDMNSNVLTLQQKRKREH
jgi:hypothetical protein